MIDILLSVLRSQVRKVKGSLLLQGQLVDEAGSPVRDARVSIGRDVTSITSDADGRFIFDQIAHGRYEVTAEYGDLYASTYLRAGSESATVVMRRRRMLLVTVRDDIASPVEGAVISLEGEVLARTDSVGTARIPFGGLSTYADVIAAGYAPSRVSMATDIDSEPPFERHVVLSRGAVFSGTVLSEDACPVPHSIIHVRGPSRGEARADDTGRWEFRGIAGTYQVTASSDTQIARTPVVLTHDEPSQDGIVIRTTIGAELEVVVVDEQRHPSTDAIVFLGFADRTVTTLPRVWRCNDGGRVCAAGLVPGIYNLFAVTDERASTPVELTLTAGQTESATVIVEIGRALAGVVVDSNGTPVPDALVHVASRSLHTDVTDERGRFKLGGLPPSEFPDGLHHVSARPRNSDWSSSSGRCTAQAGDTNLTIVLPNPIIITGRALFGGKPLSYFGVARAGGRLVASVRDPDGRFATTLRKAERIQIMGPGTARKVIEPIEAIAGAVLDLGDIELEPGQRIFGQVLNAGGAAVDDALVIIERRDPRGRAQRLRSIASSPLYSTRKIELAFENTFETRSDEYGAYSFDGIGPVLESGAGPLSISAAHPVHGVAVAIALPIENAANIDLVLLATGAIDGRVDGSSQEPVEALAERCDAPMDRHYASVEAGSFTFEDIPVGQYTLTLQTRSGRQLAMPVKLCVDTARRTTATLRLE